MRPSHAGAGLALLGAALACRDIPPAPVVPTQHVTAALRAASASDEALLGKKIFFDQTLSLNGNLACAGCHAPAVGWTGPDATINGEAMYVVAILPGNVKGSLYESILAYFDKQSCVIRKVEFYEPGGKLRKHLLTDTAEIKKVNGILVPHRFIMRDEKEDSETELTVVKVEVDPAINDAMFDPAKLKENRVSD